MPTPEDIASEVLELSDAQALVLRLPEGLTTNDSAFKNFAAELRAILGERDMRVIVLRHDMAVEALSPEKLARIGLHATDTHPWTRPELLFSAGALRNAARAGWESANGNAEAAQVCADTARKELAQEFSMRKKLDIETY